jgi:putative transposase
MAVLTEASGQVGAPGPGRDVRAADPRKR